MIEDNEFYWQLLDSLQDGVYFADRKRRITYWNKTAEKITGFSSAEVLGKCCSDNILIHIDEEGNDLCTGDCPLARCIESGERNEETIFFHHKNGHRVPVRVRVNPVRGPGGEISGAVEMFTDLSSEKQFLEKIERLRLPDLLHPLTRLPVRDYLDMNLKIKFMELKEYQRPFGILYIRIDQLEDFRSSEGKLASEELLKLVARTLLNNTSPHDTAAHWSDDEFAVILSLQDKNRIQKEAGTIRILLEKSDLNLSGEILKFTASIGTIVTEPGDGLDRLNQKVEAVKKELESKQNTVWNHL